MSHYKSYRVRNDAEGNKEHRTSSEGSIFQREDCTLPDYLSALLNERCVRCCQAAAAARSGNAALTSFKSTRKTLALNGGYNVLERITHVLGKGRPVRSDRLLTELRGGKKGLGYFHREHSSHITSSEGKRTIATQWAGKENRGGGGGE
ncbi:hypothetical protein J6590_014555 [Homalodisca vitripennis]|nr:hypothetical protein J6590_014555 [Homalodisca vitripennis]